MGILSSIFGGSKKVPPVSLNDDNFDDEVAESELPVIVDVWSTGCPPCKQLEEVILGLSTRYAGKVKVCELGSHIAPKAAMKLRVMATPTVIYFKNGKEVERITGFRGSLYHQETIAEVFGVSL